MKSIKPGHGPSMQGLFGSITSVLFGIFCMVMAFSITADSPFPAARFFPFFGLAPIAIGAVQAIFPYKSATGKQRMSLLDIVDSEEEPGPMNIRFGGEAKTNIALIAAVMCSAISNFVHNAKKSFSADPRSSFLKFPCFTVLNNFEKYIKLYSNSQNQTQQLHTDILIKRGGGTGPVNPQQPGRGQGAKSRQATAWKIRRSERKVFFLEGFFLLLVEKRGNRTWDCLMT
ncbi:hypothetical protein HNR34_001790 [Geobacillus subterraneus]